MRYTPMSLVRPRCDPPTDTTEGILFCLEDAEHKVHCLATRALLMSLSGGSRHLRDCQTIFEEHRTLIEEIAGRKYVAEHRPRVPLVLTVEEVAAFDPQ